MPLLAVRLQTCSATASIDFAACGPSSGILGTARAITSVKSDGEYIAIKNERYVMHLLFSPVLGSAIWIGGGSVGLVLLIIVVVLLLRG